MSYVYILSEPESPLWTVGFYAPNGKFHGDSDHSVREEAAKRVAYLNGNAAVNAVLGEALNSGDGVYRP